MNVLPGAVISGTFTPLPHINAPHTEDMNCRNLIFNGTCSSDDFRNILINSLSPSVEDGFNVQLDLNQKHIPIETPSDISIITISVNPTDVEIVEDSYNPGRIKINFSDANGMNFRYIPITDLGFC